MLDLRPERSELEPIETASADELAELQLRRLRWSLRHAYGKVPLFGERFDAAGVHPDECTDLSDLARFPFTTKDDLRATYPYRMLAVPREQVVRLHASSGTTGQATVVGYTKHDLDVWSDLVARSIRASGGRPGDRVHVAYGYGLFTGGLGAHYGAERLGCTVIPVSGGMTARQVQLIRDLEPDIIMVTPSYLLAILDEFRRQRVDPATSSLKVGILGAEPWTPAMRDEIEVAFDMHAVDIYGLSEVMGPGVANECVETKDGFEVRLGGIMGSMATPVTVPVNDDTTVDVGPARAVLYVRQSLDRTGEGAAVTRQEEACRALCEARGWNVLEVVTDNDTSASTRKPRPGYERLLGMVDARQVDVVCAWHVDRVVRQLAHLEDLIVRCEKTGVKLATVSGDIDLSNRRRDDRAGSAGAPLSA